MKKLSFSIFIGLVALLQYSTVSLAYENEIRAISDSIAETIQNSGRRTTAVVDFTDLNGIVTELGRFLSEELSVALAASSKRIEVIDRTHLKVILQENKLSTTGLIDPGTARKLGKIAGADTLVTGTITPFGDSVRVSIKLMDTETAKIIDASTSNIPKTKGIEELLLKEISSGQSSGQQSQASSGASSFSKSKGNGIIEDSFLRIVILSISKSGNEFVSIQTEYQNKTDKDIKIEYATSNASLVDNFGNEGRDRGRMHEFILPAKGRKNIGFMFAFRKNRVESKSGKLGDEFDLTIRHRSNPPGQISFTNLIAK